MSGEAHLMRQALQPPVVGDVSSTQDCGCADRVDAMLAERNTRIMFPIMLGADQTRRAMIVTDQIETGRGKKKACGMFATFCPFCGVKYPVREDAK